MKQLDKACRDMKPEGLSDSESKTGRTERMQRLLLIGPPPFKESGSRVQYELFLGHIRGLPHLVTDCFNLPVHRPLYNEDGTFGPLSHRHTIVGLLRAMVRVPCVDTVILLGTSDFCFSYGSVLALYSKLFRRPCAMRITGGRGTFATTRLPAPVRAACLAMLQTSDTLLVVQTEVARNDLPARLRSKTKVIRNFRSPPPDPPSFRRSEGGIRFAFVGRYGSEESSPLSNPEKGLDVLLDAFEHIRAAPGSAERIELHIYGSTPTGLIRRVQRTPGVVVHGSVANDELRVALRQHDVLAFPSRYAFEGNPGAIIEAFIAGLPVIASDLPGPMEIVEHEVNGLVVKTGDSDAFAAAMKRLVADQALRQRLAAGARASASDFDQEKVLPELVAALGLLPAATTPAQNEN